jgi:integrase
MPTLRLTKRTIEALPFAPTGQMLYRDSELTGFGVRVGRRSKVYFVESQVRCRTVRTSIGRADVFSPEAARKKALLLLGAMAEGRHPSDDRDAALAERLTVDQAFEQFFAAKPHLSPRTVKDYRRTRDVYLRAWKGRTLSAIDREMILVRHRAITDDHGAVTANNVMRHLRSVYNFTAARYEALPPNPVLVLSKTRSWHREQRRRGLIAPHQLPAWWRAVMAEPADGRDVLLLALFTGMRRSEIVSLEWQHLDLIGGTLTVPHTKNGDPLELPLSDFLLDLFRQRQALVGQSQWVFPSRGETGHLVEVKSFIERVRKASSVSFTLHDLRRTFISIAESLDIPAYALKRLLNHRVAGDVTEGYIVISTERLRRPVEAVTARMLELANEGHHAVPMGSTSYK